jgi:hypothetical protein
MTIATRALRSLHGGRRLLVLAVVAVAVGSIALSGARPAHAGAEPDLDADITVLVVPNTGTNFRLVYLKVTVRNVGNANANYPSKVSLGANMYAGVCCISNLNTEYTIPPLAAGAGHGITFYLGSCLHTGSAYVGAVAYADMNNQIDESSEGNNQANHHKTC